MFFKNNKSVLLKVVEYTLYAFFVLFPFVNYGLYLYTGTSTRAVNLIGMVTMLMVIIGFWLYEEKNKLTIPKSPILGALVLYGASMGVSAYLGFNLHTSFWSNVTRLTGMWYLISLWFFILLIVSVVHDELRRRVFVLMITVSAALYSILYFLSYEGLGIIFPNYKNYAFTFGNSTFAAMYIFGSFLLALYYLLTTKSKKWWMYLLPIVTIINPAIISRRFFVGDWSRGVVSFVGEARASAVVIFLTICVFAGLYFVSKMKNKKIYKNTVISLFGLAVLTIAGIGYSLLSPNGFVHKAYMSQATSARPLVWEVSDRVIGDSPVFGWGVDNFERVFEKYYDSRLLQDDYGNEAWFDRAHNVFVDQMIDGGYVGTAMYLLIYLSIGLCMLYVVLRSKLRDDVVLAALLLVYFVMHLLELQTAFDTSVSFVMVAAMIALAIDVFHRTVKDVNNVNYEINVEGILRYGGATLIIGFFVWTFFVGFVPFVRTQNANGYIRTVGNSEKRLAVYDTLFGSEIDMSAFLWRTSADLQRGIGQDPSILDNPKAVANLNNEFTYLEKKYREYLIKNPYDYRSHLNLADILIYVRLFENDKLEDAQSVLDEAIRLVPQSPQAYWMKSVAYIYERKFDLAREWAAKGLAVNPKVKESQNIVRYVEESIKTFPDIDLYFFKQT